MWFSFKFTESTNRRTRLCFSSCSSLESTAKQEMITVFRRGLFYLLTDKDSEFGSVRCIGPEVFLAGNRRSASSAKIDNKAEWRNMPNCRGNSVQRLIFPKWFMLERKSIALSSDELSTLSIVFFFTWKPWREAGGRGEGGVNEGDDTAASSVAQTCVCTRIHMTTWPLKRILCPLWN